MNALLILTYLILSPRTEYEFVAELMAKRELYAVEEHAGRTKTDLLKIYNRLYKVVTTDKLPDNEFLLSTNLGTERSNEQFVEYMLVKNRIRYIEMSVIDTTRGANTWTRAVLCFSNEGKGVEDKRTIEISGLPLSRSDTMRMFSLNDRPLRQELDKAYYRTLSKDLNWLTKEIKRLHTTKPKAN